MLSNATSGLDVIFNFVNFSRILGGLYVTVYISIIAIGISIIGGFIFGVVMTSRNPFVKVACRTYLESIRIIPVVVLLFIFYFGISEILNVSGEITSIIVFSLWGIAEMGDLVRGAIFDLPKHQTQSAKALGLKGWQIQTFIVMPQVVVLLLPSIINLFTRMIKTTSLVYFIGVADLMKVGNQIAQGAVIKNPEAEFYIYTEIFFIYFIVCYVLSIASKKLEARFRK